MDERRLKFFLALQKKVEESKNLSPKAREKFYGLAEQYIGKVNVVEEPESSENDLVRAYRENGFVSIETEELEVSVKNKKRSKNTITIDLNKHRPIETCRFLQFLSSNANPMKFLIHDKPDGFFLEDIKKSWAV